jgi:Hemopexin
MRSNRNRPAKRPSFVTVFGLIGLFAGAGCGDLESDEQIETTESELNVSAGVIWKTLSIPVCWLNPSAATDAQREAVRLAVANSWEVNTRVRFTGWQICPPSPEPSTGIRIQIINDPNVEPHVNGFGRAIPQGLQTGMILNLNPIPGTRFCPAFLPGFPSITGSDCLYGHAVHEFGHALGFVGEDTRPDSLLNCTGLNIGNTLVGNYDPLSVMNHCNDLRIFGTLTPGDIDGVQQFYGDIRNVGRRKDAIQWDNSTVYFLYGNKYTRFHIDLQTPANEHTDDYYPRPIAGNWGNWPTTWNSGVDAIVDDLSGTKLIMFRGNQYLKYDKQADAVDSGYPMTLPGEFKRWPSTWTSVDAGIKWASNGKIYLFRGSEVLRISSGMTVDFTYPRPIAQDWPLPSSFAAGFDYVINYPNGNAYFFKGTKYVRFTVSNDTVSGQINIVGNWPGVMF